MVNSRDAVSHDLGPSIKITLQVLNIYDRTKRLEMI